MSASVPINGYQVRCLRLDEHITPLLPAWKRCNALFKNDTIHNAPDWLLELFQEDKANVHVLFLERAGEVVGAAPFVLARTPLKCQLGEITVATFPLRRLRLLGGSPNIPEDKTAYDHYFNHLVDLSPGFDVAQLEYVKVGSFFWEYIQNSPLVKKNFRLYSPRGVTPHPLIRISGSFNDYLKKFSPKSRKNRLREIKKLREQGEVRLVRVVSPLEVDGYVDTAAEISRKSYQYNVLGAGIRDAQLWKGRLKFAAEHGWLRSYLLTCNAVPCSFLIGYQYERIFYHANVAFDPAWSHLGVGTVLQMLILEDVFGRDQPDLYDFGTHGGYKEFFSNDSYLESDIYLFSRRAYPFLAQISHHTFRSVSKTAGALLDRFDLKQRIKGSIRGMAGRP
jgi:hypothetical protein